MRLKRLTLVETFQRIVFCSRVSMVLNFSSQQLGEEYDENYAWKLHPGFQVCLTATFLGESTSSARFTFCFSWPRDYFLSYFQSLLLWKDKRTAWFTVTFFLFSVSFLLLTRQARYYTVFFFSTYVNYALFSFFQNAIICTALKRS